MFKNHFSYFDLIVMSSALAIGGALGVIFLVTGFAVSSYLSGFFE